MRFSPANGTVLNTPIKKITISFGGKTCEQNITTKLWLYNEGDECTAVTGGWYWTWSGNGSGNVHNKNETNLELGDTNTSAYNYNSWTTTNKIDLSPYTKMYYEFEATGSTQPSVDVRGTNKIMAQHITDSYRNYAQGQYYGTTIDGTIARHVQEITLPAPVEPYYLLFYFSAGYLSRTIGNVKNYKLWLE